MRKPHKRSARSGRVRKVFLSSTYFDLRDLRQIVADYLGRRGIRVTRSDDPGFSRSSGGHKNDICLKTVRQTPHFLLIIDGRGGELYAGRNRRYKKEGLTITHAETREAFKKKTGWNCYVRYDILIKYGVWVHNRRREDIDFEGVDKRVFRILDEIEHLGKWREVFDTPEDLLPKLSKLFQVERKL